MHNYIGRSSFSLRSTKNGIIGKSEAKKIKTALPNFHFCSCQAKISVAAYNTNNKPCAHPVYFTYKGRFAKYFNGMATNNKSK